MVDSIEQQPGDSASQQDLMGKMADGSELAFGRIYDQLCEPTYAICSHYLDGRPAIDEAMTDVWLYVWANARTLSRLQGSPCSVIVAAAEHHVQHHVPAPPIELRAGVTENGTMTETVSTREVYRNAWMTVREDVVRRPDGSAGLYGVVDKPDFAIVVPYAAEGFWLVEQFRYPVGRRAWEFPQGSWPGENAGSQEDLARAELQEETGMRAAGIRHLAHFYSAYGHSSQGCDLYLATDMTPGPTKLEITEQDMVHQWFSEEDFRRMIREGDIVDAATIAAYSHVLLDRERDVSGSALG